MNKKLKYKIAVTSRSFSKNTSLRSSLESKYENVKFNDEGVTLQGEQLISFLKDCDKAIVGIEEFNSDIISKLSNIKVISKYGVGLNNLDLVKLKKSGIKLGFTPGVNKRPVAELTILLVLLSLRRIYNSKENIKKGIWSQERGQELRNKTFGIVGFGNIGNLLADFLEPFECNILAYDIELISKKNVTQCSLEEIFINSDIVSIHLPLINETENIINKKLFDICKDNIKLINTSRGGIILENDLYDFLDNNKQAFAALDVFEEEPAYKSPLLDLENFFATSHLGSMTEEGVVSMGLAAIDGLENNKYLS